MVALERCKIPVQQYVAYEIDKNAIAISQKNYPQIIHCGGVRNADLTQYKGFDLLIGGEVHAKGFLLPESSSTLKIREANYFFEFVRALREVKPKYFILENVKMKQEFSDQISSILGVKPIEINSSLVSAQRRKRLYWTNIPNISIPDDKGILLKDIVHETVGDEIDLEPYKVPFNDSLQILERETASGKIGYFRTDAQAHRVYSIHNKSVTLLGEAGGGAAKMGQYLFGCITPDRLEKRQNGQRFNDGEKFYTLTAMDKHGILIDGYIRKITPIECERLQTLPDNYTAGVSENARYKALGNGFTVDVISHILNHLPNFN